MSPATATPSGPILRCESRSGTSSAGSSPLSSSRPRPLLARLPYEWRVEVVVDAPLEDICRRVPATLGELTADGERTRLELGADSLEWAAGFLAGLGADFRVIRPDELRAQLRGLAERLARAT
jgi:predicted DNA-binding transcriptional regulator YafY